MIELSPCSFDINLIIVTIERWITYFDEFLNYPLAFADRGNRPWR
jgi:hypothetical protein